MSLQVCGLLILLGLIFAAMILAGLHWCGRGRGSGGADPKSREGGQQ